MITTADIAEVEDEIRGVTIPVHAHWRTKSRAAVREFVDAIEEDERQGRPRDARYLLLLLLLLLRRRTDEPMPAQTARRIAASSRRLLAFGAAQIPAGRRLSLGQTFTTGGTTGFLELQFISAARMDSPRMRGRLDEVLRVWSQRPPTIAPTAPGGMPPAIPAGSADRSMGANPAQTPPRLPPPSPSGGPPLLPAPADLPPVPRSNDLIELEKDLQTVVSDPGAALSQLIVDAWAYRQFNIGIFEAAKAAGVRALVAVNPMDERTTPFCRWVNGKIIRMERIERQLGRFRRAVADQSREAVIEAWPFISMSEKAMKAAKENIAQDRSPGARVTDAEVFRRFFVSVGLPPYHWRCRTRTRPI